MVLQHSLRDEVGRDRMIIWENDCVYSIAGQSKQKEEANIILIYEKYLWDESSGIN